MLNLRFDFRLSPHSPATMAELYDTAMAMARWADGIPGSRLVFSQHHASADGYLPSPMLLAATAAASTRSIPISVGALLLLMYDPVKLAEDMSVLDHLSNGRVNYIVGLGYRDEEYAMFGVDRQQRGALIEEYLRVLQQGFGGRPFQWRGRDILVTPAPLTANGPPLAYGGGSVAAARRAARHALPFSPQVNNPELLAAYDEEAVRCGHPTGRYHVLPEGYPMSLFVAEDIDRAWRDIGDYLLHDALMYGRWLAAANSEAASFSDALTVDALREQNGAYRIVNPREAIVLLERYGSLGLQPLCGGIPAELAWQSLKLIEEKVLPGCSGEGRGL